jgi:hypothetical protein
MRRSFEPMPELGVDRTRSRLFRFSLLFLVLDSILPVEMASDVRKRPSR